MKVVVTVVAVESVSSSFSSCLVVPVHVVVLCPAFRLLSHMDVWEIAKGTHSSPCLDVVVLLSLVSGLPPLRD